MCLLHSALTGVTASVFDGAHGFPRRRKAEVDRLGALDPELRPDPVLGHPELTIRGHQELTHPQGGAAFVATRN
jgi:hypothetical protein